MSMPNRLARSVYAFTTGMARRVARKPRTLMAALMTTEYRVRTSSSRKKAHTQGAKQAAARTDSAAVLLDILCTTFGYQMGAGFCW